MDVIGIALTGLQTAQHSLDTTAQRLSNPEQAGDTVDLSSEMASFLDAKNQFAANAQVVRTATDMQKNLIDMLG